MDLHSFMHYYSVRFDSSRILSTKMFNVLPDFSFHTTFTNTKRRCGVVRIYAPYQVFPGFALSSEAPFLILTFCSFLNPAAKLAGHHQMIHVYRFPSRHFSVIISPIKHPRLDHVLSNTNPLRIIQLLISLIFILTLFTTYVSVSKEALQISYTIFFNYF
jgi:hypothetical protein